MIVDWQGDKEALLELYKRTESAKSGHQQSSMTSHAVSSPSILIPTIKDGEVYDWIKMIVRQNLPLSVVENDEYRIVFKHKKKYSRKLIKRILFHLVTMVEDNIKKDLKEANYGALMHDGWSKYGTHYVALFAQFNKKTYQQIGMRSSQTVTPASVLLAVRPMLHVTAVDNEEEKIGGETIQSQAAQEATSFTAEVHAKFFKDVLRNYDVDLDSWAVCQVSCFF